MAALIHEHRTIIRTPEGLSYVPRTYGRRRPNGMWEGWLEFHPVSEGAPVLRTDRDTTQKSREELEQWALGLDAVYFEGAFKRARVLSTR